MSHKGRLLIVQGYIKHVTSYREDDVNVSFEKFFGK